MNLHDSSNVKKPMAYIAPKILLIFR